MANYPNNSGALPTKSELDVKEESVKVSEGGIILIPRPSDDRHDPLVKNLNAHTTYTLGSPHETN